MNGRATLFLQGSFDRQNESVKRKLASEFLSTRLGYSVDTSNIELPPNNDPRKADFIFNNELFQVVIPSQETRERNLSTDSPVQSVARHRSEVSRLLKGQSIQQSVFGGDYLEDLEYTITAKFLKYGKVSADLILVIECIDIFLELFDVPIASSILAEVGRRIEAKGVFFKEIWLVKRWIVNDVPTYVTQLRF